MNEKRNAVNAHLSAINLIKSNFEDKKRNILNDPMLPEEAKRHLVDMEKKDALAALSRISGKAQEDFLAYYKDVKDKAPRIDIYSEDFLKSVNLIKTVGKNLSNEAQERIVKNFTRNKEALQTLQPIFEGEGLTYGAIGCEEAIRDFKDYDCGYLYDAIYYGCNRAEEEPALDYQFSNYKMDLFEKSNGIKPDSEADEVPGAYVPSINHLPSETNEL